jgi:hypothetical protein
MPIMSIMSIMSIMLAYQPQYQAIKTGVNNGPPAKKLYAVDPTGEAIMRPSARYSDTKFCQNSSLILSDEYDFCCEWQYHWKPSIVCHSNWYSTSIDLIIWNYYFSAFQFRMVCVPDPLSIKIQFFHDLRRKWEFQISLPLPPPLCRGSSHCHQLLQWGHVYTKHFRQLDIRWKFEIWCLLNQAAFKVFPRKTMSRVSMPSSRLQLFETFSKTWLSCTYWRNWNTILPILY